MIWPITSPLIEFPFICIFLVQSTWSHKIVVTGGTGVLGKAILSSVNSDRFSVYYSYRDDHKIEGINCSLKPFNLNTNDLTLDSFASILSDNNENIILINNAGICLPGSDAMTLSKSLQINCLLPYILTKSILMTCHSKSSREVTIINISSGDGELVYLHSQLQDEIHSIQSLKDWELYVLQRIQLSDKQSMIDILLLLLLQQQQYAKLCMNLMTDNETLMKKTIPHLQSIEYAMSDTPMYSYSKALLNKLTQLLHREYSISLHKTTCDSYEKMNYNENNNDDVSSNSMNIDCSDDNYKCKQFKVVSVCPGNFASPMSTPEELESAIPVQEAASHILDIVLNQEKYSSGNFYRYGDILPW